MICDKELILDELVRKSIVIEPDFVEKIVNRKRVFLFSMSF